MYYFNPEDSKFKTLNTIYKEDGDTIICIVICGQNGYRKQIKGIGKSKCSPNDVFDKETGRKIARNRAYINVRHKAMCQMQEYYNILKKEMATANKIFKDLKSYNDRDREYISTIVSEMSK